MQPQKILTELKKRGLFLQADGKKLHFIGPSGSLDAEILAEIRAAKPAIISLLTAPSPPAPSPSPPSPSAAAIEAARARINPALRLTPDERDELALALACLDCGIDPESEVTR
jgi:hypothetical protein